MIPSVSDLDCNINFYSLTSAGLWTSVKAKHIFLFHIFSLISKLSRRAVYEQWKNVGGERRGIVVTRTVKRMASDGHVQTLVLLPACKMGTDNACLEKLCEK